MVDLLLGNLTTFQTASRYTITLESGKQLVLFKLSHMKGDRKLGNSDGSFEYFCMNQECPHAGGPMEDSTIEYDIEEDKWIASCPWHSYDFNVETGESSFGMKTCTYQITIKEDQVWIRDMGNTCVSSITPVSEAFRAVDSTNSTSADLKKLAIDHQTSMSSDCLDGTASICDWCTHILNTADPESKIELTQQLYKLTSSPGDTTKIGEHLPPDVPPRKSLKVIHPAKMPKLGRAGNIKSRIAILHSLANIEQWAIDLALDICARFATFRTMNGTSLPRQFFLDWIKVANDEAKHFSLLRGRLEDLGSYFGELPVHHGLWDSAALTSHDLRARISIIALVHEARGLDVNPQTIAKFRNVGDSDSVEALETIHKDEITHVTTGHRWLTWICEQENQDPIAVFRANVSKYFMGAVKGPFNIKDRQEAGLEKEYYEDLDGRPKAVLVAGG